MDARLEKLLHDAPGPAPWYWRTFPGFTRDGECWAWQAEQTGEVSEWPVLRRSGDGVRCFVPGFYCYAVDAGDGQLLTWRSNRHGALDVALHRVERLEAVELPDDPRRDRDTYKPSALEVLRIPPLDAGAHDGFALRTRVALDELLLLASPAAPTDHDPALAIYVWEPTSGRITVVPQPWFTGATHDLGYEWVTKVARDPESGRIVGEASASPHSSSGTTT
jgi:hypothetical protein